MILTLTGKNSYALQIRLKKEVEHYRTKSDDFGLLKLQADTEPYESLLASVQTVPFLTDHQLVIIYNPSTNKDLSEKIKQLLSSIHQSTDVIFVEPTFDKRSSLYKVLKKETNFIEYNEPNTNELTAWIIAYAKDNDCSITTVNANYLVQRVGNNQKRLQNELDKLYSYAKEITKASIDLLTQQSVQSTIFDLLDAALSGNTLSVLRIYDEQRKQKIEPQEILAMLTWQLHVLAIVKAGASKNPDTLAREAKINPFVVRKTLSLAKNVTMSEVKLYVQKTLQLDIRLKTMSVDAHDAMVTFLMTLRTSIK